MLGFVKELINAFNLNNYYPDNVNANFTVEDGKIVGLFEGNVDIKKYIEEVKSEIITRHCGNEDVASRIFNLKFFPFNADERQCIYSKNGKVKKLAIDISSEVIFNLKFHFAVEFLQDIEVLVATNLKEVAGITKQEASEYIRESAQSKKTYMPSYLYSIYFSDEDLQEIYVNTFKSRLQECGLNSSVFYKNEDDKLHVKDITDINVVKSIAKYVAGRVALDFRTSGDIESKVENCKNILSDLILKLGKKSIDGYDYDVFTDEKKKRDGYSFVIIPKIEVNDTGVDITKEEADRINEAFRKKGLGDILIDVRGQTENTQFTNSQEPVYGISNKQLALLIHEIMKSPIKYNAKSGHFEYAVSLGNFYKSRMYSDLSEDLELILTRKFIPKDGKVHDYIWNCLSESGFGLDGYNESELIEFVDKKIEEKLKADLHRILKSKCALNAYDYVWQRLSESEFGRNGYNESKLIEFVDDKIEEKLKEDLHRILESKCALKVYDYVWQRLSESEFGRNGYNESELIEFVDKKIEEKLSKDLADILESNFPFSSLKVYDYVWQRLSESGFGRNGYDKQELEKEIECYLSQPEVVQQAVNQSFLTVPVGHRSPSRCSNNSADSGHGTDSRPGSLQASPQGNRQNSKSNPSSSTDRTEPLLNRVQSLEGISVNKIAKSKLVPDPMFVPRAVTLNSIAERKRQLKSMGVDVDHADNLSTSKTEPLLNQAQSFVPRAVRLNRMAASRSVPGPQQSLSGTQKAVQVVQETPAKPESLPSDVKVDQQLELKDNQDQEKLKNSEELSTLLSDVKVNAQPPEQTVPISNGRASVNPKIVVTPEKPSHVEKEKEKRDKESNKTSKSCIIL